MPYNMWIPFKYNTMDDTDKLREELRQNWLEIERWPVMGAADPTGLPFIVVADDGTGDFTSIKEAIEATTDTLTNTGGRFIWVKPGTYDDSGDGIVDLTGRNVQVFAPTAGLSFYVGSTQAVQAWKMDGFTCSSARGFVHCEGLQIQLAGTGSRLLNGATNETSCLFLRCIIESDGTSQAVVASGTFASGIFTDCNLTTLAVFRGATSFGSQLRFFNCVGTVFSAAGGAATVTGNPTIRVIGGNVNWAAGLTMNGTSSTATGQFVLEHAQFVGGDLTLDDIGTVEIHDCYTRGTTTSLTTWSFTTNVGTTNRPNFHLASNDLRDVSLKFVDGTGSPPFDHAAVFVSGSYRQILCEISYAEVDVFLDAAGYTGALIFVADAAGSVASNFRVALRGGGNAANQAWVLAGADHIVSLTGYANAPTASSPAPAAPPSVAVNGTHVFTVTN